MSEQMNANGAKGVVPRLRFPGFKTEAAWHVQPLGKACTVNPPTREIPASFIYVDLESVEKGQLVRKTKMQRDEAPSRAQRAIQDQDVLFQIVRPYQRNNLLFHSNGRDDYVASTGYAQLRAHTSAPFLYQTIHTDGFVAKVVAKCTGSNYPAINPSDLAEIPVAIPENAEQQKIAACLSSLDDLIAAHADKLAALKQHKQGLLEQLFPREGETVPRLRFPEFRCTGAWEKTTLSHEIELISGQHLAPDAYSDEGEIPYFTGPSDYSNALEGITKWTARSRNTAYLGDTLITVKGSGVGELLYLELSEVVMGRQLMAIRSHRSNARKFLYQFLRTRETRLHALAAGNLIPGLSRGDILHLTVSVPTEAEQARIGNCLSTLDTFIAVQSDKLAALKEHKQGLLQQLFPVMDAVA